METPNQIELFRQHLLSSGKKPETATVYVRTVRAFLKHVAETDIERISEETTREYFQGFTDKYTRTKYAMIIGQYLGFARSRLPAVITREKPRKEPTAQQLALRTKWNIDKLVAEKESRDDLVAKLGRKLIDHYLYFEKRINGTPEDLDEIARFADECKELIQSNLALFMQMSAAGRNVHTRIDERAQT